MAPQMGNSDNPNQISKKEESAISDFGRSAIYSFVQNPLNMAVQTYDCVAGTNHLPNVQFIDAPTHADAWTGRWMAQGAGSMLGTLPYFLLGNKVAGSMVGAASETRLLQTFLKPSPGSQAILQQGLTGFGIGFGLKPLDEKTLQNNGWWKGHIYNGISDAAIFGLQTTLGLRWDKSIAAGCESLSKSVVAETLGLSSMIASSRFAPAVTGALSGAPSAYFGTIANAGLQHGVGDMFSKKTLAEASDASASMMFLGFTTSAMHKPAGRFAETDPRTFVGRDSEILHSNGTKTKVGKEGYFLEPTDLLTKAGPILGELTRPSHNKLVERANEILQEKTNSSKELLAEQEKRIEKLTAETLTDELTRLPNRRAASESLDKLLRQAVRTKTPLSAIFADFDNFKMINKIIGNKKGDEVIVTMSDLFKQGAGRPTDVACRLGGDELFALLSQTSEVGAAEVMRKIQGPTDLLIDNSGNVYQRQCHPETFEPTTNYRLFAQDIDGTRTVVDTIQFSKDKLVTSDGRTYVRHGDELILYSTEVAQNGQQKILDSYVLNPQEAKDPRLADGGKSLINTSVSAGLVVFDPKTGKVSMKLPELPESTARDLISEIETKVNELRTPGTPEVELSPTADGRLEFDLSSIEPKNRLDVFLEMPDRLMQRQKTERKRQFAAHPPMADHTVPAVDSKLTGNNGKSKTQSLSDDAAPFPLIPAASGGTGKP